MDEITNHGGDIYLYIKNNEIKPLDYSANINPLGLPAGVKKTLADSIDSYSAYPDIYCRKLTEAVSFYENIKPDSILFGNGAADLIFRICYALMPKSALLTAPTFSEYEKALLNVNCKIEYYSLNPENNFDVGNDILEKINGKDIVFICNPNNPTGNITVKSLLYKLSEKCLKENCYMVIDECFMDFVNEEQKQSFKEYLTDFENVIIVKAFTKTFAMAGLRLGYCLCHSKRIIYKIRKSSQPWSVSTPAQIAGIAALKDIDYLTKTAMVIKNERGYLTKRLRDFGFKVFESHTNFILFRTEQKDLYDKLYKKGILIRKCDNFNGIDNTYYRIAVKCSEDNEKLINAISELINNG